LVVAWASINHFALDRRRERENTKIKIKIGKGDGFSQNTKPISKLPKKKK
jgi:hypothetical protein